ncbi:BamA/TamA family outer membrane protein [Marinilabiliaceae bacterium ANBcel2]|nr:BamA/TamA family outer membrane protein [Marinilabiliaceae bacterium ANBcel2]
MFIRELKIADNILLLLLILLIMGGCKSTKYVPEGEKLLTRVKIDSDTRNVSNDELRSFVRQQENIRILGFWKFNLGIYNLSGRDETKGFNQWLRRIGEPPVLFDSSMVDLSVDQMRLHMRNRGFFHASVSDTVVYPSDKKARVEYDVESGPRYRLNDVYYHIEDETVKDLVFSDTVNTVMRRGRPFTVEMHNRERDRITELLRNNGYYSFSREYIYFIADSSGGGRMINDTLVLMRPPEGVPGVTSDGNHAQYAVRDVYFQVGSDLAHTLGDDRSQDFLADTINYNGYYIIYEDELDFKPDVLVNSNYIIPGDIYSAELADRTQILLSGLRIFRYINIRFREIDGQVDEQGRKILDCVIHVDPGKYQSYSVEIEGTNSSGNLGAAGNIKYQHKNLFKGAELFTLNTRLARQNQFVVRSGDEERFNTMEFGAESSIVFPQFLMPFRIEGFRQRYNPSTTVALGYNYQRRPDYTRTIANARLGYNWRASRYSYHSFFPFDFNLVNIPSLSDNFRSTIEDTFLEYAYQDHLIANLNYSYLFNEQEMGRRPRDFRFFRFSFESAGNLFNLTSPLWSNSNNEGKNYNKILGIRYAQYLKGDVDLRYHKVINRHSSVTYRLFAGVGVPYGNLDVLPFEKRYFSGGANSIRAWPVRSLGPGSYKEESLSFYNQTADIKLEANVEYRFPLVGLLEGALFVDAGNIWGLRAENSPEGGAFKIDRFYQQIAVGSGFGTRFDFNYFIFRIDTGLKLRDPAESSGERWIPLSRSYSWDDVAFNFAIGYPF